MPLSVTDSERERFVADLLAMMGPQEKAGQLAMREAPDPDDRDAMDQLLREIAAGRVGTVTKIHSLAQAEQLQQVAHDQSQLGIPLLFPVETGTGLDTVFPARLAAASSWDMDAIEAAESVIAGEARARGFNWALAPEIALSGSASRSKGETSGEDCFLASRIGAARVRGLQEDGKGMLACLELTETIPDACSQLDVTIAAISGAKVGAVAFDGLQGEARAELDRAFRFLKGPGGFDGILLSEWDRLAHDLGTAEWHDRSRGVPGDALVEALDNRTIETERVDNATARVLRAKFRLGLLSAAFAKDGIRLPNPLPTPFHNREVALHLAKRSAILLRNEPCLLPLGIDSGEILLVGSTAGDRRVALAGKPGIATSIIDGLEQLGIPHRYVSGLALRENGDNRDRMIAADKMAIGMASEAAKRAGTVILALAPGEDGQIGDADRHLLSALYAVNHNLILITLGPVPVDPEVNGRTLPAILHAGQLGTMSGDAIAELLTGEASPCAKLPLAIGDSDGSGSLPFGHGLTYGDFALTDLSLELGRDRIYVFGDLRNIGEREGLETVQLYLQRQTDDPDDTGTTKMPLADFQRIRLAPGQRETLTFELGRDEIGRHRADGSFHVEGGSFEIFVGLNSTRGLAAQFDVSEEFARAMAGIGFDKSALHGNAGAGRS